MPGAGKGDDETVFTEIKITDVTPREHESREPPGTGRSLLG